MEGIRSGYWSWLGIECKGSFSRKKVSMWKVGASSEWFNFDLFKNHYELPRNLEGKQKYSVVHGQKFLATKIAQKTLYCQKLKCITQGRRSCNSLECNHRVLPFSWRNPWHAPLWRAWTPGVFATLTPFISVAKMHRQWKGLVHDVANSSKLSLWILVVIIKCSKDKVYVKYKIEEVQIVQIFHPIHAFFKNIW